MSNTENSVKELMAFFSAGSRTCTSGEFMAFWKALTDEEKSEFKAASLV